MSKLKSLIPNDNIQIDFVWDLWGAEVDLLSILMKGKKEKISGEDISKFLAGVLDSLIFHKSGIEGAREVAIIAKRKEGKSEDYIKSYLNGWDSLNRIHIEERENNV